MHNWHMCPLTGPRVRARLRLRPRVGLRKIGIDKSGIHRR